MKPRQLAGRFRRLVPPRVLATGIRSARAGWTNAAEGLGIDPAPQFGPARPPHETGTFIAPGAGLLSQFHFHGFAPLAEYAAGERSRSGDAFWADVVGEWVASEARPRLPSWHPYPTSLRLIAWSAALPRLEWPDALRERVAGEIARQARYLRRTVEHDVGGNHVLKNATALVFAGATVPGSGVLAAGVRLLQREVERQILFDGGHEERSTSYHRVVRRDLEEAADILARVDGAAPAWLVVAVERTRAWEAAMTGPDGRLPLLNDAWEGPLTSSRETEAVTCLAESGYVVFRSGGDQATFDVGPLSPPHLPPHAHADALSFVFWVDGRSLVVDPGSYAYTGPWRDRFRGTAAHNTVEVDSRDQCRLWGDFRLAFPPQVRLGSVRTEGDVVVAIACHDGYRRLQDPVLHHRAFVWVPRAGVVVVDRLQATRAHAVRTRLHFAPDARHEDFEIATLGGGEVRRQEGAYSPFLGRKEPIGVLEDAREIQPETLFGWSLLRRGARVARLEFNRLELTRDGGTVSVPLKWG
jgi:uncharacterized heparinase superfamily protein